jgi:signal transduction histidine kinase/ActR/RegA family two-component response regulator
MGERRDELVLALMPVGRDAAAASAVLGKGGLEVAVCRDLSALVAELEAGAAVAMVTEEAFYGQDVQPLGDWIERQPPWSDFPFVLLTRGHGANLAQAQGPIDMLRNVTLLERPVQTVTLVSAVQTALRGRRRQYETKNSLLERELLTERLEELVAERTRQLEVTNERLRAEIAEREEVQAALLQSQKLETIGQLTGGVAHDFNNLLTAVLGNLELATQRTSDDELRRILQNATRAAGRGATLTQQLLAFSRKQHLAPAAIDMNGLVSNMSDLLFRTIGATVRIETVLQKDLWPALIDSTQVELVILNLALNARDAMPHGGSLRITTANLGTGQAPLPKELPRRDYVTVSVADTGTGMSPDVLAKAFEPFFTTKDVGKGSGLGLSQVYGVAHQSGGTVQVETRLGEGSTFTVFFPRADAAVRSDEDRAPRGSESVTHASILVVDDDEDVRELTIRSLRTFGYRAIAVESGRAALDVLERGEPVDLLLLDFAMPAMNGTEIAQIVRASRPDLPVIFMTGYADIGVFGKRPAEEVIIKKPFTMAHLAEQVASALHRRQAKRGSNVVHIRPASEA